MAVNKSSKNLGRYAGKWVALDTKTRKVVAAGKTLKDIASFVTGKSSRANDIKAVAFKVPRKDEGPYVLTIVC